MLFTRDQMLPINRNILSTLFMRLEYNLISESEKEIFKCSHNVDKNKYQCIGLEGNHKWSLFQESQNILSLEKIKWGLCHKGRSGLLLRMNKPIAV